MSDGGTIKYASRRCTVESCLKYIASNNRGCPKYCMPHMLQYVGEKEWSKWKGIIKEKNKKNQRSCAYATCAKVGNRKWEYDDGEKAPYFCRRHYDVALQAKRDGKPIPVDKQPNKTNRKQPKRMAAVHGSRAMKEHALCSCDDNFAARVVCNSDNCAVLAGGASVCANDISAYTSRSMIENANVVEEFEEEGKGIGLRMKAKMNIQKDDIIGSYWTGGGEDICFVVEVLRGVHAAVSGTTGSRARYINHRCGNSNCRMEVVAHANEAGETSHLAAVLAEGPIKKNEALSIRYAPSDEDVKKFFSERGETCKCGHACCVNKS